MGNEEVRAMHELGDRGCLVRRALGTVFSLLGDGPDTSESNCLSFSADAESCGNRTWRYLQRFQIKTCSYAEVSRAKSSPMCDFWGPEGVSRVESTNHTRHKLKIHNCLMNGIVCRTVVDKSHQTPDSWANSRGLLGNHPRSTHAFSSCSPAGSLHSKHTAPPPHPRTWRYREARRRQDLVFSVYVNYGLATLCFAKCLNWESWSVLELLCRVWEVLSSSPATNPTKL